MSHAAEGGGHLQSEFHGEGIEAVFLAYLQIAGLAVIEHAVGIALLPGGEIVLPVLVGHLAIGDVALQVHPVVGAGQCPVVGQREPHLRHRAGIDAERLRARAEAVVLQLHGLLLAAHGQCAVQPAGLGIGLLHHHAAREMIRHGHIHPIAHTPAAQRVGAQGSLHAGA